MAREVADDFFWIQECHQSAGQRGSGSDPRLHTPQNAFLFVDDETALFDTLSRAGTDQILSETETLLDGRDLDYLIISHPETPHAGNTTALRRAYPDCTLIAADRRTAHELYYLDDARRVRPGDVLDLGRYTLRFEHPIFLDHSIHLWMSERRTGTLFTVDWIGFPHGDDECLHFVDELPIELPVDRLRSFHERVFIWFAYADTDKLHAEVDHIVEELDPSILAPSHGLVIREDASTYLQTMKSVIEDVSRSQHGGDVRPYT